MIRACLRLLSGLAFVSALVAAVIDSARSIAASSLSLTSFAELWGTYAPESLGKVQEAGPAVLSAGIWGTVSNFVLAMPAAAVLMVLAILLYMLGYKREHSYGRFASN
jgi:hypothetical protein